VIPRVRVSTGTEITTIVSPVSTVGDIATDETSVYEERIARTDSS